MRTIPAIAFLLACGLALPAAAQTGPLTPAPVPSDPARVPPTGNPSGTPEIIAPVAPSGGVLPDSGPANASPFGGAPTSIDPGTTSRAGAAGSSSSDPAMPPLSR